MDTMRKTLLVALTLASLCAAQVRKDSFEHPVRQSVRGVHGAIAEHYKVLPGAFPPHATTLDYIVAAAAG